MKCPICGNDVEFQNRPVGTDENHAPVFVRYAICRDCRKQWNLDKLIARKKEEIQRRAAEEPEPKYGNIPPKHVKDSSEKAVRQGYEDMLATDDYEEDAPRFRVMRILLGLISLAGLAFCGYKAFPLYFGGAAEGVPAEGMTYIMLALCMLAASLLYFIMQNKPTIFAFLVPMVIYFAASVLAFVQKGDSSELLITSVASAVLGIISLVLALLSQNDSDEYEDDYEDDNIDAEYEED